MKDSQPSQSLDIFQPKYIKESNERFSTFRGPVRHEE